MDNFTIDNFKSNLYLLLKLLEIPVNLIKSWEKNIFHYNSLIDYNL